MVCAVIFYSLSLSLFRRHRCCCCCLVYSPEPHQIDGLDALVNLMIIIVDFAKSLNLIKHTADLCISSMNLLDNQLIYLMYKLNYRFFFW